MLLNYIFSLANIGILSGYLFLAAFVAPSLKVSLNRTRIGGSLFFLTCGLTHLDMAIHSWNNLPMDYTSWHGMSIHLIQVVAVWLFVGGLYKEFIKGNAEWPPKVTPGIRKR